jgi:hypothetical protein
MAELAVSRANVAGEAAVETCSAVAALGPAVCAHTPIALARMRKARPLETVKPTPPETHPRVVDQLKCRSSRVAGATAQMLLAECELSYAVSPRRKKPKRFIVA